MKGHYTVEEVRTYKQKITAVLLAISLVIGQSPNVLAIEDSDNQMTTNQNYEAFYEQEEVLADHENFVELPHEDKQIQRLENYSLNFNSLSLADETKDEPELPQISAYKRGDFVIQKVVSREERVAYETIFENGQPLAYKDRYSANDKMLSLEQYDGTGQFINYVVRQKDSPSLLKIIASNRAYAITWPLHGQSRSENAKKVTETYNDVGTRTSYLVYETLAQYNGISKHKTYDYVNITAGGLTGNVHSQMVDIIPYEYIRSGIAVPYGTNEKKVVQPPTYRSVKQANYNELQVKRPFQNYFVAIGIAPDWLDIDIDYYSFDDNYFYEDLAITQPVTNTPYHNYYQYLPFESRSAITAKQMDDYTYKRIGNKKSTMHGLGQAFVKYQEKTDINAMLTYALAVVESATGTSALALNKYNLFGWKAVDSNAYVNADQFDSPENSVYEMMSYNLKGYTNTNDWRYHGTSLGNKEGGLNVQYSSTPYWGQIIASVAYRLDQSTGFVDFNRYQLAMLDNSENINILEGDKNPIKVRRNFNDHNYTNLLIPIKTKNYNNQTFIIAGNKNLVKAGYEQVKIPNTALADARFTSKSGFLPTNKLTQINRKKENFTDLSKKHWAYHHIQYLSDNAIIRGFSDQTFKPDDQLTRAQAASMLVSALGITTKNQQHPFKDVSGNHWAVEAIASAYQADIINGYNDDSFKPDEAIKRDEISAMINRALKLNQTKVTRSFTDLNSSHWAYPDILSLASHDIINGYKDGSFKPSNHITRAEFSSMLAKTLYK